MCTDDRMSLLDNRRLEMSKWHILFSRKKLAITMPLARFKANASTHLTQCCNYNPNVTSRGWIGKIDQVDGPSMNWPGCG